MNEKDYERLKKIHKSAWNKAKKKCPPVDVNAVILYVKLLMAGDKSAFDLAKDLGYLYREPLVIYIKDFAKKELTELMKDSGNEVLQNLAKDKFADTLVKSADKIFRILYDYSKGTMSPDKLAEQLCNVGIDDLTVKFMKGCGIDSKTLQNIKDPQNLLKLASPIVAYNASLAAYRELRKALDDLELAREERAIVEKECNRSIEMIRAYKTEMEERVSQYLSGYLEEFNEGFRAMDEAILNNDTDGYIKGNVQIQKALGYDVQFTNQEEFDDLMDSEEAFKL